MNVPKISDILNQKIEEIQARLPVKLDIPSQDTESTENFSDVLNQAFLVSDSSAPLIPAELLERTGSETRYPLVSGSYESVYPRLSRTEIQELMPRIDTAIESNAKQYNLDPSLVRAVMKQESGFQPFALSTSGAMGLMQLMPGTAAGLGVTDAYNIEQNIKGGSQYLYYQLKAFDGNLEKALAAYNAGPNAVKKYDGIPPYQQTQNYVKNVKNYYEMYKSLGG